jgi:hypothetical protein
VRQLKKVQFTCNGSTRKRIEKGAEEIIEKTKTENFSQLMLEAKSQILEAQRTPNWTNGPASCPPSPDYTQAYHFQSIENQI